GSRPRRTVMRLGAGDRKNWLLVLGARLGRVNVQSRCVGTWGAQDVRYRQEGRGQSTGFGCAGEGPAGKGPAAERRGRLLRAARPGGPAGGGGHRPVD